MAQEEKALMKEEKLSYLWQLEYEPGMSKYEEKQFSVLEQSAEKEKRFPQIRRTWKGFPCWIDNKKIN